MVEALHASSAPVPSLQPLDAAAVIAMVTACELPPGIDPTAALERWWPPPRCAPLFVEELLSSRPGPAPVEFPPRSWTRSGCGPADLDKPTLSVLGRAALLGRRFDWSLLAAATGLDADVVLAGLRHGVEAADRQRGGGVPVPTRTGPRRRAGIAAGTAPAAAGRDDARRGGTRPPGPARRMVRAGRGPGRRSRPAGRGGGAAGCRGQASVATGGAGKRGTAAAPRRRTGRPGGRADRLRVAGRGAGRRGPGRGSRRGHRGGAGRAGRGRPRHPRPAAGGAPDPGPGPGRGDRGALGAGRRPARRTPRPQRVRSGIAGGGDRVGRAGRDRPR